MAEEDARYSMKDNAEFQKNGRLEVRPSDVEIAVVSAKDSFRSMARTFPTHEDVVLEIGCATGETTRALLETGASVVAVDKSAEVVHKLQEVMRGTANAVIACLDGRNIPGLAALVSSPTVIFIDVGGDAHLDNVALQLRLCLRAFQPRLIVVRSFELATLASLIGEIEPPQISGLLPTGDRLGRDPLSNLLDLSESTSTDTRCFAARRLGGLSAPRARDRLHEMTSDPHPSVRRAAQRACQTVAADLTDEGTGNVDS